MDEIKWEHAVNQNGLMVHFGFQAAQRNVRGIFVYHPEQEELVCKVLLPHFSPQDRRKEVAELMTRYNGHLYAGNFALDWESGLILFSVYLLTNDNAWINRSQLRTMLLLSISETMQCLSLFDKVIEETKSPEKALSEWYHQQEEKKAKVQNQELMEGLGKYGQKGGSLFDQINNN